MAKSPRVTFTRALRIAGYNWPLYAFAGVGVVFGIAVIWLPGVPPVVRWLGPIGAAVAAWFAGASFGAFHWMFDRSELLSGQWLTEDLPRTPARWVQISVGLEETTLPLFDVFPGTEGKLLDLYNPEIMTEPAVTRAKEKHAGSAIVARPDALPVEDGWADIVVVTLAAHEIRNEQMRERFFHELRRVISVEGKVVVVEHLRDLIAALTFGPGFFHFYPRSEWLRLGQRVEIDMERERRITPFVRVFVYHRR